MKTSGNDLSGRLEAVVGTVIRCEKCLDVGCDHGYTAVALVSRGIAGNALCTDINEGPLNAARANIAAAGLADVIETRLSDGLHNISLEDCADTAVIAGMGGALTCRILSGNSDVVRSLKQLVLQPQSELFLVRALIRDIGFHIASEKFLEDAGKYYYVMDVRPGKSEDDGELTDLYDKYSKYLIVSRDPLYIEYIKRSIETCEGYLKNLSSSSKSDLPEKIKDLKKVLSEMTGK